MIIIPREQLGYRIMKRREIGNLKRGWKQLAKKHFDELELGYDEFEGRMCLIFRRITLPRQIHRKSDIEKGSDYIAEYSREHDWKITFLEENNETLQITQRPTIRKIWRDS